MVSIDFPQESDFQLLIKDNVALLIKSELGDISFSICEKWTDRDLNPGLLECESSTLPV